MVDRHDMQAVKLNSMLRKIAKNLVAMSTLAILMAQQDKLEFAFQRWNSKRLMAMLEGGMSSGNALSMVLTTMFHCLIIRSCSI